MNTLLDGMRERLEGARERHAKAQQVFQAAQAELQAATAEYGIWNSAIGLLMREEEKRRAESDEKQIPMNLPGIQPNSAEGLLANPTAIESTATINKTERVREILRAHETGLTTGGIWTEVKDHISSRAYLYAILKRLRDNDEVCMRRGKYLFKVKTVESKAEEVEAVTIQ
jgi:hypothetical protein